MRRRKRSIQPGPEVRPVMQVNTKIMAQRFGQMESFQRANFRKTIIHLRFRVAIRKSAREVDQRRLGDADRMNSLSRVRVHARVTFK
jgi:hypothetical protein